MGSLTQRASGEVGLEPGAAGRLGLAQLVMAAALVGCGADASDAPFAGARGDRPYVVATVPDDDDDGVDPSIAELRVTFDRPMRDGNWSWVYEDLDTFPEITGDPYFEDGNTTNVLPVRLEPDRAYTVWVNASDSPSAQNFKDEDGVSAVPFRWQFATRP